MVLVLEEVGQVEELGHQLAHVLRVGARQRASRLLQHHRDMWRQLHANKDRDDTHTKCKRLPQHMEMESETTANVDGSGQQRQLNTMLCGTPHLHTTREPPGRHEPRLVHGREEAVRVVEATALQ